jgi:DNA-binding MarR family transcriptional regulator
VGEIKYPKGLGTIIPDDESQPHVTAYFSPPKEKKYPVEWLVVWKTESEVGVSLMEQALCERMTLTDYRLRDYLLATIGIDNCVYVNQAEVARKLNVRKATICESIKRLCEMKILLKGPKSGKSNTYSISPAFCFIGKLKDGIDQRKDVIKRGKVVPFRPNPS